MYRFPAQREGISGKCGHPSKKVLTAVLMVAVMVISCFAILNGSEGSSASPAQNVVLCDPDGQQVKLGNGEIDDRSGIANWSAHYEDGVLSLNDRKSDFKYYLIDDFREVGHVSLYADGDLTIRLMGSNPEMIFETYGSETLNTYGIYVTGDLTIINDVTVSVDRILNLCPLETNKTSAGIYCGGSLSIINNSDRSFTVEATGADKYNNEIASNSSYGIYAENNITISNTTVNATGGKAISTSAGIYCGGSLSVTNTEYDSLLLTVTGSDCINPDATGFDSYGIYAGGDVSFTDTSVSAIGGQASRVSAGIYSGGTVHAIKSNVGTMSVDASGSKNIYADGTNRGSYSSFGICAAYIDLKNVNVTATAEGLTVAPNCGSSTSGGEIKSIGINCSGISNTNIISGATTLIASGGSIDVTSYKNSAHPAVSAGIYVGKLEIGLDPVEYSVTSCGGDIYRTASATNGGGISYGIFCTDITSPEDKSMGEVNARGGVIFVSDGSTKAESYGIYTSGSFKGDGCQLTATANDATKISCGIRALGDFDSGENSSITCNAGFVPMKNGMSIGLYVRDYIGGADSNAECNGGVVCYWETTAAGIKANNITLEGNAILSGNGGYTTTSYTSETEYRTSPFKVTSGDGSDTYGAIVIGNITVKGTSRLECIGGDIETYSGHGMSLCTYGISIGSGSSDYTISGTGSVIAVGGETKYGQAPPYLESSVGLLCKGKLKIDNATVTATGGKVCKYTSSNETYNGSSSIGLKSNALSLTNGANVSLLGGINVASGTSNLQAKMPYYNDSYGAYIEGELSISGSNLYASADKASRMTGLYVLGAITVSDSSTVDSSIDPSKREGYVREDDNGFSNFSSGIVIGSEDESADISVTNSTLVASGSTAIKSKNTSNTVSSTYLLTGATSSSTVLQQSNTLPFSSLSGDGYLLATYQLFTVSFNGNGGTNTMGDEEALGTIQLPTNEFTAPVGKDFSKWAEGSTEGTQYNAGAFYTVTSDVTFYAIWVNHTYTISFYANGGSGDMEQVTRTYGQTYKLPGNEFTAPEYKEFKCWRVGETEYAVGEEITIESNVVIMPVWTNVTFTVYWKSQNGLTILETDENVPYGSTVSFDSPNPTKANDAQYVYSFAGWAGTTNQTSGAAVNALPTVSGDTTYYAAFSMQLRNYTVTLNLGEGGKLANTPTGWGYRELVYYHTFAYGTPFSDIIDSIVYDSQPISPTKTGYTFSEWEPNSGTLSADASLAATYTINKYLIKFVNYNGTILQSSEVVYGNTPSYIGETPLRAADVQYTYTFRGWDPEIVPASAATTYTATYDSTVIKYTIRFVNDNGDELQTSEVAYGETPAYTGETPTKAATAQYSYTFKAWAPEIVSVTGDATYTATFTPTLNKYTVTWKSFGGTVLETDTNVPYDSLPSYGGEEPIRAATPEYEYLFDGWSTNPAATSGDDDGDLPRVTGDVTYYAVFIQLDIYYKVTWKSQDGASTIETDYVTYETMPHFDSDAPVRTATTKYTYTFAGWATSANQTTGEAVDDLPAVTGDVTYYAAFSESINKYTVTFNANGGNVDPVSKQIEYDSAYTLPEPTYAGHKFGGWKYGNDVIDLSGTWTIGENINVVAQWTEYQVVITFFGNENTDGTMDTQTIKYSDASHTLASNGFTKTHYVFVRWDTDANGTGTSYGANADVSDLILSPDVVLVLYAQWQEVDKFTVSFEANGGTPVPDDQVIYDGEKVSEPADPEKTNYVFAGWYSNSACTQVWNFENDPVTDDLILYAKWDDHVHVTTHTVRQEASCETDGNIEYWYCSVCGKYFSDASCTTEINSADIVIGKLGHDYDAVVTDPTCTEDGYTTHTCSRCHDSYVDTPIAATGHNWTSAEYTWSEDGKSCVVIVICGNDPAHRETVTGVTVSHVVKTESTTSAMGVTEYFVSGTYNGFDYASTKDVTDIPALEPMPAHKEGTTTYENDVTENLETVVTETFNTAKTNGGDVELTVSTTATGPMTIAFDNAAVNAIGGNAVSLQATVRDNVTNIDGAVLVIEVTLNGATFSDGKAKVSVPFTQPVPEGKTLKVYFINGDQRQDMNATLVDGNVVFETNHFSTYAIVFEDAPAGNNGGGFPIWIVAVIAVVAIAAVGGAFFFMQQKKSKA